MRRFSCHRIIPSSPASQIVRSAITEDRAEPSIVRALRIPAASLSNDGSSAYALLNQNNTLTKLDLNAKTQGTQIRVGNAPHSIVINPNGTTAYVSNEGGRAATGKRTSRSTPPALKSSQTLVGAAITGTVSVVDLPTMTVTKNISTGLHATEWRSSDAFC